jgi:hypothetical protein
MLALKFRVRLSTHINARYITGVNFYAACNLGGMSDVYVVSGTQASKH